MTDHPLTPERIDAFRDRHIDDHSYAQAIFDAGREHERTTTVDARPWEPLNGPVRAGDEVRQDRYGLTITGVVARTDGGGDPWTSEGALIGLLHVGTWYVRRPVRELPAEDGAVIVPAEGHEYIAVTDDGGWTFDRMTYSAEHDRWYGMTLRGAIAMCNADQITPGTWKVDTK